MKVECGHRFQLCVKSDVGGGVVYIFREALGIERVEGGGGVRMFGPDFDILA